jgi:lysophospholipase L1-like esterase
VGSTGIVLGTIVIMLALNAKSLFMGIGGLAIAALGLWLGSLSLHRLDERRISDVRGAVVACIVTGLLLVLLSIAIVVRAFDGASAFQAALGAVIGAVGLVLASRLMLLGVVRPERWVAAGAVLATIGLIFAFRLDIFWAYDIVPIVVGAVLFRVGIRPLCERSTKATGNCTIAGLAATLVGLFLVLAGAALYQLPIFALGVFLLFFGLTPLSIGWQNTGIRPVGPTRAFFIGIAVAALGFYFWPKESPDWLPVAAAILIVVLGVSFSVRGEGFLILALVSLGLVWVLLDHVDQSPVDPNTESSERILALGDSYTSGEGSTMFFPGTNVEGDHTNGCRRSSTSYAYIAATAMNMGLDFFACSGATAAELYKEGQMIHATNETPGRLPQLKNPFDTSKVRLVLVSVGGNDAGFGKVGIACVLPGSCDALHDHWLVHVGRIGRGLTDAYAAIRDAVGDSTPVVAVPYPLLIREEGCGWSALTPSEHDFLAEFITVVDDRVRKSAEEAGINFFEPGLFAFEGAKICDGTGSDDTVMNFFNLHPTEGEFMDRVNPTNWVHGTFHPKPSGHEAIAAVLVPWVEELLADIDAGTRPANPPPNPDASFSVRRVQLLETVLFDPRTLPIDLKCRTDLVPSFGTLLPLIDAGDSFPLNASSHARVCYTLPDGTWTDDERDVVIRTEGEVRIQPQLPEHGYRQFLIYKDSADHTWQLEIVEFCNQKPRCPTDPGTWMVERTLVAAEATVLPAILVFMGAWLVGLAARVALKRWT